MSALPEADLTYLLDRGIAHEVLLDSSMICVTLPGWAVPSGFDQTHADLLLRLAAGYPDVAPDMWWFSPAIRLANGAAIPATDSIETYFDRQWQRWSRHFTEGQWQSGIDGLESFLALIRRELERSALQPAQ